MNMSRTAETNEIDHQKTQDTRTGLAMMYWMEAGLVWSGLGEGKGDGKKDASVVCRRGEAVHGLGLAGWTETCW